MERTRRHSRKGTEREAAQRIGSLAEAIVETVREPLLILNGDMRIRAANHSFYEAFQVSPEETENRSLYELGDGQWDIPRLRELLEQILPQNHQIQDFEVEHHFPEIGHKIMLLNARRLRLSEAETELILVAIDDITRLKRSVLLSFEDVTDRRRAVVEQAKRRDELEETIEERTVELKRVNEELRHENMVRKRAEKALMHKMEELDAFTSSVSHDLKEPLRAMEAFSQFLLGDCADRLDEQGRDYVMKIADASIRMKNLIDDLLMLSRASRWPGHPVRIDVGRLVGEAIAGIQPAIDARGAALAVEKRLPDVLAEPAWIKEVFVNLTENALKFNESEEPRVKIGVRAMDGGMATLYVQDNGIGIDSQYHERIFGIFERLNRQEEYEGTGAGLAIVKRVVENLGGKVWVESELGAGATFLFTLPLWTKAAASRAARAA